jgi:two-component system sensor histidine kinase CiaH
MENPMFQKLRLRLITASMISVAAVLILLIGAINGLNYRNIVRDADRLLTMIADNNGQFPEITPEGGSEKGSETSLDDENTKSNGAASDEEGTKSDESASGDKSEKPEDAATSKNTMPDAPGSRGLFGDAGKMTADTPFESRYFTVVFNSDGDVDSVNVSRIAAVDEDEAQELAKTVLDAGRTNGFSGYYRFRLTENGDQTLVSFLDCNRSLSNFRSFLLSSLLVAVIGFAAILALVIPLSGRAIRPMQENYQKQKRFITDAGHELKTPLTIINADLSVLESDVGTSEWIDDARAQTDRLARLTEELVYLSRMDEDNKKESRIAFPLSDVVQEEAQSFRSRALTENKSFESQIEPMLTLTGDTRAIRQLVSILLDNALKYSEENGSIKITLSRKGKQAILTVKNTTKEIRKEELGHLFDRFYRTDRSRNSRTGGYGLGLSIAQAVVSAHGGKIAASTEDGHSLEIRATLPLK